MSMGIRDLIWFLLLSIVMCVTYYHAFKTGYRKGVRYTLGEWKKTIRMGEESNE